MIPEPNELVTDIDLGLSRPLREIMCAKSLHQPQGVSPRLFFLDLGSANRTLTRSG